MKMSMSIDNEKFIFSDVELQDDSSFPLIPKIEQNVAAKILKSNGDVRVECDNEKVECDFLWNIVWELFVETSSFDDLRQAALGKLKWQKGVYGHMSRYKAIQYFIGETRKYHELKKLL